MKLPQVRQRTRQGNDVPSATHVHSQRQILSHREIVNCREMKDACCLLANHLEIGRRQTKPRLADIPFDNPKRVNAASAQLRNTRDLFGRPSCERWLDEQNKSALLACETLQKPVRYETGESGYEKCLSIRHRSPRV